MSKSDPLSPDGDPFGPPAISTVVGCLHCGEEYDSYRIEWRILDCQDGKKHGFWCCPIPGCDGRGFGFDILPVDPNYHDENGGWVCDDDYDEEAFDDDLVEFDEKDPELNGDKSTRRDDDDIPF